jgi:site-specific DNA-methyltransferase (adenine-specific)
MRPSRKPLLPAGIKPYYLDEDAGIAIILGDCREILPELHHADIGLVLTDPPYGIRHQTDFASRGRGPLGPTRDFAPVVGDDEPFDPRSLLEIAPCILWGANYYADKLPISNSWLVWDKREREGVGVNDQADGEIAWSNATKGVRIFRHMWNGMWRASEKGQSFHPTQKPVALMRWALGKAKPTGTVLDPYMGSGPVALACKDLSLNYVGIEIEERYCQIAAKRLQQSVMALA